MNHTPPAADQPRDLIGYGRNPPHAQWPGGARIALQFVLNYEEGSENNVMLGDSGSETFLSEIIGAQSFQARHLSMESIYEYGSRVGAWRLVREFERRSLPLTVFGVSMALQQNPELTSALLDLGHEIACHSWRWIHYQHMQEDEERRHIALGTQIIRDLTNGQWPLGWYTGRDSPNTKRLVADLGGYEYDSDYYGDDLPFWMPVRKTDGTTMQRLIVPYTLDTNDMRFAAPQGFNTGDHFYNYLKDAFDVLYAEGEHAPKMLNIGMHCRILGRPARMRALQRFLDYVQSHDKVWICRRIDIARHWAALHPAAHPAPLPQARS
jgi:allantoinase